MRKLVPQAVYRHVGTKQNPADLERMHYDKIDEKQAVVLPRSTISRHPLRRGDYHDDQFTRNYSQLVHLLSIRHLWPSSQFVETYCPMDARSNQ